MHRLYFLFTCYNRIEKTTACINSVKSAINEAKANGMPVEDYWYITDAGSNDGTVDSIRALIPKDKLHLTVAGSDTYYSQGMRMSMEKLFADRVRQNANSTVGSDACVFSNGAEKYGEGELNGRTEGNVVEENTGNIREYVFLVNDDVAFYKDFLVRILADETANEIVKECVFVGATDDGQHQTYGGVKYISMDVRRKYILPKSVKYRMIKIDDTDRACDTFNANCVMIPMSIFEKNEVMDGKYVHSLGDFDYGLELRKNGAIIQSTDYFVGRCCNNSKENTWMDIKLGRLERIKRLNSIKGSPTKVWFYFLKKNFGMLTALVHSVTPYIRIVVSK